MAYGKCSPAYLLLVILILDFFKDSFHCRIMEIGSRVCVAGVYVCFMLHWP